MKNVEFSSENDIQLEDWSDDSDFDQAEEFEVIEDGEIEPESDDEPGISLTFSSRRMQGLKNGLTARRMIEQLREQQALHRQLEEYDDFDFLN